MMKPCKKIRIGVMMSTSGDWWCVGNQTDEEIRAFFDEMPLEDGGAWHIVWVTAVVPLPIEQERRTRAVEVEHEFEIEIGDDEPSTAGRN